MATTAPRGLYLANVLCDDGERRVVTTKEAIPLEDLFRGRPVTGTVELGGFKVAGEARFDGGDIVFTFTEIED